MKKTALLLVVVLLAGCNANLCSQTTSDTTYCVNTVSESDEVSEVQIEYPIVNYLDANEEMKNYINGNLDDYKKTVAENMEIEGMPKNFAFLSKFDFYQYNPNILSFVFNTYQMTGGAHGNTYYQSFTFDTENQTSIGLTDIFDTSKPYLNTLSGLSRQDLLAQGVQAGDMLEAGVEPKVENFSTFALTPDNFIIYFPPYSVGPYVIGMKQVYIPWTSLSDYVKPEYKIVAQEGDNEMIICTADYNPVCGEDGVTYGNKCGADSVGAKIAYDGECKTEDESN